MAEDHTSTRRRYLQAMSAAGLASATGLSGCLDSLTGGGGGPINIGSILPITGDLSDFGPGMQTGVEIAVEDINDAGGPMGRELEHHGEDSETDSQVAQERYNTLVNEEDIVGFVGAASSGVSVPLAEGIADDQVAQVSPASTSPVLAELGYNDDESVKYFARTAPNDGQQGIVMGRILDNYVEAETAAFLHVDNAYGEGLAEKASEAFGGETVGTVGYSSQTSDYTSTLDQLFENDPDAVGFVGYPESGQSILQTWSDGGYGGEWVLSEGLNSQEFFSNLADIVEGMYVASPDPETTDGQEAFAEKFREREGSDPAVFSPHSYDAAFLMALAMHAADEASGTAIAENIQDISGGSGDTYTVGEFEEATSALDDGDDINYQGASSPVDLNDNLEPLNQFAILQINDAPNTETLETIPRSEFEGEL